MKKTIVGGVAAAALAAAVGGWLVLSSDEGIALRPDEHGMCHALATRFERSDTSASAPIDGSYRLRQNEGLVIQAPYQSHMEDPVCARLLLGVYIADPGPGQLTMFCHLKPNRPIRTAILHGRARQGMAQEIELDLGCIPKEWAANGDLQAQCWRAPDTFDGVVHLNHAILSYPCEEPNG